MEEAGGLPGVRTISLTEPFRWLAGAWRDLWAAPMIFLLYGTAVTVICGAVALGLVWTGLAFWSVALAAGFVFIAPVIAMGIYEGGRMLEMKQRPTLQRVAFVRSALRRDAFFLGLALLIIFGVWLEMALITSGLAASRIYPDFQAFAEFALTTPAGRSMLLWGTVIGGILAWFTFCLVVVSAPMLLDRRYDIFTATVTSVRCVVNNTLPMLAWAATIGAMILASVATGFFALIVIIPWLGLASWRAYRSLVQEQQPTVTGAP